MSGDTRSADRKRAIRHLRQLIQALDNRVPQIHRVGEVRIAREAAELRARAVRRLKELGESE